MQEYKLVNVYTQQARMGFKCYLQITTPCRNTQIPIKCFPSSCNLFCMVSTRGLSGASLSLILPPSMWEIHKLSVVRQPAQKCASC